jgi:hypothetical protein
MRFSVVRVLVILGLILGSSYFAYEYGQTKGYAIGLGLCEQPLMMCVKLLGGRITKNGVPQ